MRIDGEIAPRRIFGPVVGERDHGVAAVGFHVTAQRGDLEGVAARHRRDGAVIHAGLHHLDILAASRAMASLGGIGTAMSISTTGTPSMRIAHGAADKARFAQCRHDRQRFGRGHPAMLGRINPHRRSRHLIFGRAGATGASSQSRAHAVSGSIRMIQAYTIQTLRQTRR